MVGNDVSADRMELFRRLDGAKTAGTLQEIAANADAVVTMLPESDHVLRAYEALLEYEYYRTILLEYGRPIVVILILLSNRQHSFSTADSFIANRQFGNRRFAANIPTGVY